jgi:hypothetical protein
MAASYDAPTMNISIRTKKPKLVAASILLTTVVMILTIAGYATEYGFFQYKTTNDTLQTTTTTSIGLLREKVSVTGSVHYSSFTSDFSCPANASSKCTSQLAVTARNAGNFALSFSIIAFVFGFVFLFLDAGAGGGMGLKVASSIQLCFQIVYIVSAIVAHAVLAEYFRYSLNVSALDITIQPAGAAFIVGALIAIVNLCLTVAISGVLGRCLGRFVSCCGDPADDKSQQNEDLLKA